ncbi:MAG: NAD(+)/NADH kinase [Elusimicrobiaceae bacterium]|jgi:NAD+ kinase
MTYKYSKVAIFYNERKASASMWNDRVSAILRRKGVTFSSIPCYEHSEWKEDADLVISIGGDGTVLHAARDLSGLDIPLLPLNAGSLGFLSTLQAEEFEGRFDDIFNGRFVANARSLLTAHVERAGQIVQGPVMALNDCIVRAMTPRAIKIDADIDGVFAKPYLCDGLIVATPSGSTAYALAASGPIIYPSMQALLLVPICPHTLTQRPLVLPGSMTIRITPDFSTALELRRPVFSVDGQVNYPMEEGDEAVVRMGDDKVNLLLPPEYNYFNVLSGKLKWGE